MSAFHDNALIGASGQQGYKISRSVRLRSSASAYLNRTPASAGDRQKFTISFWMKRGTIGTLDLFTGNNANGFLGGFRSDNTLYLYDAGAASGGMQIWSQRVFRDPSAWYHIVIAVDTTQATDSNRFKVYINGIQETISTWNVGAGASRYPSLNANFDWNNTNSHEIGYALNYGYFDGYFTEFNNVSGQQLDPSSFGETDAVTGVWKPKKYTGTYGTNGFYLNFSDNSGATATTIGKDYSGNGNNWTTNNISLTAGTTYDSMTDVPTLTSATAANYSVANPLSTLFTVTAGNMDFTYTNSTSGVWYLKGTLAVSSDKYYWEVTPTNVGAGSNISIGIILSSNTQTNTTTINLVTDGYVYHCDGNKYSGAGGATGVAYGATYTNNDVIGVALDLTAGTLVFYKNNVSQGTAFTGLTSSYMQLICNHLGGTSRTVAGSVNAGQRPFTYTPPTGFVALNTQNLPAPTISNGASYMAATTYTGTGSALTIANTIGNASFQPDLVWVKGRSGATDHALYDAVRGVQLQLESNTTTDETTETTGLTAFGSTGFTVGALAQMNTSAATYVAWQWKEGATQGFDIVTYTGNGSARTISHNLGVVPNMIIVKARTTASTDQGWPVYHSANTAAPETDYLLLNSTAATADLDTVWNDTAPTSSVFSVGTNANVNANNDTYVAYLFAAVAGYSAFGSYTGNNLADGPFVYLGFRPRFIMFKDASANGVWMIMDTARNTYNVLDDGLAPNNANAESSYSNTAQVDFLSNGFKIRATNANQYWNNISGNTIIYAAFAESPFRNSLAF